MKKRGVGKRAMIELSLKWILVLVVGAVIVFMAVSFSAKQKQVAQAEVAALFRNNIDAIFNTIKNADELFFSLNLPPKIEIDFNCISNSFSVSGQPKSMPSNLVIFSAEGIEKEMYAWSLSWEMPFSVTHFFYATSPKHFYAFVGANDYFDKIPEKIKKGQFSSLSDVTVDPNDYEWVRLIFFTASVDLSSFSAYDNVDAVQIYNNQIKYYFKQGNSFTSQTATSGYIDDATVFGAIFSNKDGYDCAIDRAKLALAEVAKIYKSKIGANICYYSNGFSGDYANAGTALDGLGSSSTLLGLSTFAANLKGYNENLKANSCMTVY